LRLCQVQTLEAAFVANGWLRQECDAFNAAKVAAISGGTVSRMDTNLYALVRFVVQPATAANDGLFQELPSRSLQQIGVSTPSEHPCSYSELVNPQGEDVDFFVSHFWGHDFSRTTLALARCAAETSVALGRADVQDVVFWLCAVALNQHHLQEELGSSPEDAPFNVALMKAAWGVVMVLDESAEPFRRIWCIFEVHRALFLRKRFRLQLGGSRPTESDPMCSQESLAQLTSSLRNVSAFEARASSDADRRAIWFRTVDANRKSRFSDFDAFQRHVAQPYASIETLCPEDFSDFDASVRRMVATPLLEAALQQCSSRDALDYIGMGAECSASQLRELAELGADFGTFLPCRVAGAEATAPLIWLLAREGRITEVRFLLACGSNPDDRAKVINPVHFYQHLHDRSTALMQACYGDHAAVATALINAAADVNAQSTYAPPLFFCFMARLHGREIAALLLERQAEPEGRCSSGNTALHASVSILNEPIVELLISRGVSPNVRDGDGATPLHAAAVWGHARLIALLLEHEAEVKAEKEDRSTALHRAAQKGHVLVVSLLLQARADAGGADGSGRTALKLAESAGHTEVAALLL
jgi:ankyrin repeat protein